MKTQAPSLKPHAFTLIELLVVVTIIVVLLALLVPAMEQAIYRAELATCAARLKAGTTGILTYAVQNKSYYPHRVGARNTTLAWYPDQLASNEFDDRTLLFTVINPKLLLDPFSGKIDIVNSQIRANVASNYMLWYGWRFLTGQEQGNYRIGESFTWKGDSYHLLLSDEDRLYDSSDQSSHPDLEGRIAFEGPYQDAVNPWPGWNLYGFYVTYSKWTTNATGGARVRGPLDLNYAYDDGAVKTFNKVGFADPNMGYVPDNAGASRADVGLSRQIAK